MTEVIEGTARDVTQTALTVTPPQAVAHQQPAQDPLRALGLMTDSDFRREVAVIRDGRDRMLALQAGLLRPEVDYGTIPGTPKPTLLQPGAEALAQFHRLIPEHRQQLTITPGKDGWPDEVAVHTECRLHRLDIDGPVVGSAVASCSSYEDRYLYRNSERVCPSCGKPAIYKSKPEWAPRTNNRPTPGYEQGGWKCGTKKGGCGRNFPDNEPSLANAGVGKEFVDNPRGLINTITQISAKRAFVGAVRHTLNITDLFTQDIEDMPASQRPQDAPGAEDEPPPPTDSAAPAPAAPRAQPPAQAGRKGTAATFPGTLIEEPQGTRSTPDGSVLRFKMKVGRSNHHVDVTGRMAPTVYTALHNAGEGCEVVVVGTRHEEKWEGQGDKPDMKVIREVTSVTVAGQTITEQGITGEAQRPAPAEPEPSPFDDDGLDWAPGAPQVALQTGDPNGPTVDITGIVSEIRWEKAGGKDFVYLEVTNAALQRWRVAVQEEYAREQFVTPDGSFGHAEKRREVRVIGGWSKRGDIVVATVVIDAKEYPA